MSCILLPKSEKSYHLATKYNFKEWMIARYLTIVPDTEKFLDYVNNRASNQYIRINSLKIDIDTLKRYIINLKL